MFDFGILQPYVDDEQITDIDSNSKTVYVTHQYKGTYKVEIYQMVLVCTIETVV